VTWQLWCRRTNIHNPNREDTFWDKHGNAKKTAIVAHYNCHMGYGNKVDIMANSYKTSHSQQLHPSVFIWGGRKCHIQIFDLRFSRRGWLRLGISHDIPGLLGRTALVSSNISRSDTHNKHWPGHGTKPWCCVCSARYVTWRVKSNCIKCEGTHCAWTDTVSRTTTRRKTARTPFRPSSIHTVETSSKMRVQEKWTFTAF
jgi:hypothetical protein